MLTLAQINGLVGDIRGNVARVIEVCETYRTDPTPRIVLFPELTLTGYPPEDLLLKPEMAVRVDRALENIVASIPAHVVAVVGFPHYDGDGLPFNAAAWISADGITVAHKQALPNYSVFDEQRYFRSGDLTTVVDWQGMRIGLLVCEDLWRDPVAHAMEQQQPDWVLVLNASPYHKGHPERRRGLLERRAREFKAPVAYVNWIGGQDELVFDGRSCVMRPDGEAAVVLPAWEEAIVSIPMSTGDGSSLPAARVNNVLSDEEDLYRALVVGVRDYVGKNGFDGAVLGLSGGIDSALTLAIASDALGAEKVRAVMMPYHYTSTMSLEDAEAEARLLGVQYDVIPIAPMVEAFMRSLEPVFAGMPRDTTEENLQARCRGVLLMALSNKLKRIVLTTGNKSEMAVGYATLYGDMAGGFGVLKDVFKTWVYRLARYRNSLAPVIPERVIERPPSAELAPDQKDEDSLPPYDQLDAILEAYIERDESLDQLLEKGFDRVTIERVMNLVDINEHKRRQAPPGVRVTARAFGRDRRYPITSGYRYLPRGIREDKP